MRVSQFFKTQSFPLLLTIITFGLLTLLLYIALSLLNFLPLSEKISLTLHPADILVGLTIYVKTAIDFAIFIGNLMHTHPGWGKRIAIELGTALGNGIGTLCILVIWVFFKEIPVLLTLMIIIASLVLLRMAQDGLEDYLSIPTRTRSWNSAIQTLSRLLNTINRFFDPVLGRLLPHTENKGTRHQTFWSLFFFAITIPFLLGLDDFAGYIPLFSIINVFGFATGVFLGHMLLTAALFTAPEKTARLVRLPIILVLGSVVFVGLSIWGLFEAFHTILLFFH